MSWDWAKHSQHLARLAVFGLASVGWVQTSPAQDHTADPYKPYNQQYEQFVYPSYPSGLGLTPNQGVLEGRTGRGPNQFQRYLDESAGDDFEVGRRRTGPGIPYYSAYRQYDREYGRVYQPNQASDQNYYKDRNERHEKYLAYLKERDPKKRAELYREYTDDSRRVARDLANPRAMSPKAPASGSSGARVPRAESSVLGSDRTTRRLPGQREKTPSEVLRESDTNRRSTRPRTLTAPGLAPRNRSSQVPE